VRRVGESRPDTCGGPGQFLTAYGSDYFYAAHAIMLDRPYPGQRTFDLLRVFDWLADIGHRDGVRVNTIHPGYIETDRLARRIDAFAREHKLDDAKARTELARTLGIERFGQPADIGRLVAFLVSDAGSYIHGATIDIDEGVTKGM